jgi:hypothetical protein
VDWSDERYVRVYTRDTVEWMALSWQARGLFCLVLRKCDRAGIIELGRVGIRGVAVACGAPWAEVEAPLRELLADGCLSVHQGSDGGRQHLVVPNFVAAQESISNGKARQQTYRERREARARGAQLGVSGDAALPPRDAASQNVTLASSGVTPGDSSRADTVPTPCRAVPGVQGGDPPAAPPTATPDRDPASKPTRKPKATRAPAAKRGHRLPSGWQPSQQLLEHAAAKGHDRHDVLEIADAFRDHWLASTSRTATKLDWDAAFRTWLRRERERAADRRPGGAIKLDADGLEIVDDCPPPRRPRKRTPRPEGYTGPDRSHWIERGRQLRLHGPPSVLFPDMPLLEASS